MPHDEVQDSAELTMAQVLAYYGADTSRVRPTGWVTIKCPFHNDRHASARVSLSKEGFACQACGVKGSPVTLIMDREHLEYREACDFAANVLGASHSHVRRSDEKPKRKRWRSTLFD